ncbi:MAG: hypothetical protein AAB113_11090 [Candidatus Eisenbacteria bacterium]
MVACPYDADSTRAAAKLASPRPPGHTSGMVYFRDTHPEAERVLIEMLRRQSFSRKLAMMDALCQTVRALMLSGLRERNPGAGPEQLEAMYAQLTLGRELAERALAARRARQRGVAGA